MKPRRFSALAVSVCACTAAFTTLGIPTASAISYYWDGTAADNDWGNASNWSLTTAVNPTPTAVPGNTDVAFLTASAVTGPFNLNLNGNREVMGIQTAALTTLATLFSGPTGTGAATLSIGSSGITHSSGGGLTIGSLTDATRAVNIAVTANQKWTSSASGTGQAAILINNAVSNGSLTASPVTLTLGGINTGSTINGAISDGAAVLNLAKTDNGLWTLASNANTYTGTTSVNAGILRLMTTGSLNPATSATTVAAGATLALRTGATNFTATDIDYYRSGVVTFAAPGAFLGLDTTGTDFTYASNINGAHGINKIGSNTLTLSGTNTYTGTTNIREGGLNFASMAAYNGNAINVESAGVLTTNTSNLSKAEIDTIRTSSTFATGTGTASAGTFAINTGAGDFIYDSLLTGTLKFQKSGTNSTIFLNQANTNTGGVTLAGGILSVNKMADGGIASGIGSSASTAIYLNVAGGTLRYTGAGDSTNRLFQMSSGGTFDSSGTGALIFTATGANTHNGASARTLTLTGYNKDANRISGIIANSGATTLTGITKLGSGNWTLSGANSFTGTVRGSGGTLTLDYATSDPLNSGATLLINSGTIELKGRSTGVTTETIAGLTLSDGNNGLGRLYLNGNGGSGVQLTVNALTGHATNSQRHDLIDISGNAGNSITLGPTALGTTILMTNNVLMNANGGRASIILRDTDGSYGFASLSGPTSGTLQKLALANQTALSAGSVTMNVGTTNYLINAPGTYSTTGNSNFSTLTVNSSPGAVTLDLGANTIATANNGRAILFSGSNDVTVTGTNTGTIASSTWVHNYLDAGKALNFSASMGTVSSSFFLIGGTGTTIYSGTGLAATFSQDGGLFRATKDQTLTSTMRVNAGGVFEIGADLNGGTAGDFTHAIGTGAASIQFNGDAGLSAFGGNRVANFGGAGASVTWGAGNFLTHTDGATDGDFTFKLSSSVSDSNIEVQNAINLNGKTRAVDVANGSAAVDATLSGALTGGLAAGLIKTGAGTLSLTGTSTYQGLTRVDQGKLIVGGGGINASTSIEVRNSTLEFGTPITPNSLISDNALVTLQDAVVIANNTIETMGALILVGDNQMQLAGNNQITFSPTTATQTWSRTLQFLDWVGNSTGGGDDQIHFGVNGVTTDQQTKLSFLNPNVDGVAYTGVFGGRLLANGEFVAVIPEPSAVGLGLLGAAGLVLRRRRSA